MDVPSESYNSIIIIGAGGHGAEISSYIYDISTHYNNLSLLGFIDEAKAPGPYAQSEILGDLKRLKRFVSNRTNETYHYITAVGDNKTRKELVRKVENLKLPNLIGWSMVHPTVSIGQDVVIGEGACIAPHSVITTRVVIGRHCIVNVNSGISHDSVLGYYVNLNPGCVICGNVTIGEGSYIGAGTTVINDVSIGKWSIVGAGSVVISDIPDGVTALGVPARVIKKNP